MKNYFLMIKTYFLGVKMGEDAFGNRYYYHKDDHKKRWVVYAKKQESTLISPQWHGWIHGYYDFPLDDPDSDYQPNQTGTVFAHQPHKTPYKKKSSWTYWHPEG